MPQCTNFRTRSIWPYPRTDEVLLTQRTERVRYTCKHGLKNDKSWVEYNIDCMLVILDAMSFHDWKKRHTLLTHGSLDHRNSTMSHHWGCGISNNYAYWNTILLHTHTDTDLTKPCVPFYSHGWTLIPAWISNYVPRKVWDEITYPFLNFNGCTVEV